MWSGRLKTLPSAATTSDCKQEQRAGNPRYLADIVEGQNTSSLPSYITHVRLPNGEVRRIRFA